MVVASIKIACSGKFPNVVLHGGCLCYSSMLSGCAFEVSDIHWIGRQVTRNNEHVRHTYPFLNVTVFPLLYSGVAPKPCMKTAALGRPEDKLNHLLTG